MVTKNEDEAPILLAKKTSEGTCRVGVEGHTTTDPAAFDNIRIVLNGLRGEDSIAVLCRKVGRPRTFQCKAGGASHCVRHGCKKCRRDKLCGTSGLREDDRIYLKLNFTVAP